MRRLLALIVVAGIVLIGSLSCTVLPPVDSTPPYASVTAPPGTTPSGAVGVCDRLAAPGTTVEVGGMAMMVNAVVRPADGVVATGGVSNPVPQAGNEFVMLALSITCLGSDRCALAPVEEFALVGPGGGLREPQTGLVGVPGLLGEQELPGGATVYGAMVFEVGQEETGLTLMYDGASASACLMVADWLGVAVVEPGPSRPGVLPTATPVAGPTATPWPTMPLSPLPTPTVEATLLPTSTALPTPVLLPESGRSP